jgi:hypothetical protein
MCVAALLLASAKQTFMIANFAPCESFGFLASSEQGCAGMNEKKSPFPLVQCGSNWPG